MQVPTLEPVDQERIKMVAVLIRCNGWNETKRADKETQEAKKLLEKEGVKLE